MILDIRATAVRSQERPEDLGIGEHQHPTGNGQLLLPDTWRDHARTTIAHDPDGDGPDGFGYGRHWWTWPHRPGLFAAHGFEGQFVVVWPEREITLVHFGVTPRSQAPGLIAALDRVLDVVG